MRRDFEGWTSWIVDLPWLTTLVIVSLSLLAIQGYRDPDWIHRITQGSQTSESDSGDEFASSDETPPDVEAVSLTNADAIIVVESNDIFSSDGAKALRFVVDQLEGLDYVRSVLWMDRVPIMNIFGLPEPLFPRATASENRFEAARERAIAHPLVGGQLVSKDGKTLLLMIGFDWLFVESDDDCVSSLREAAEKAAAKHSGVDLKFSVTGRVPLILTAELEHERNQLRYQLIGYGMIALMALVLFRGFTAVFVVALAPSLGVFWTLGCIRYFDLQHNPFSDVVLPVLLSLVGLTDGVHLMVQIRRLRVEGMAEHLAARTAIRDIGLACALTSITTAIGFGSLTLAHHETVREFGIACVIGVFLTFIAVITVIPLACSTWLGRRVHAGYEHGVIDRNLDRVEGLVNWVLKHPRKVAWVGVLSTLLFIGISLCLRPDERNTNALPEGCEPLVALQKMDRAFGGLEIGNVDVRWNRNVHSQSPEVLEVVTEVDKLLNEEPLIGTPLSIRNFIDALPGDGPAAERMSLLELLPPPLKRAFYVPETRDAQVSFRVQDLGIAKYGPVFTRVQNGLAEIESRHPDFRLSMSGSAVWRWENLYQIVVDLATSLGSAAVVIFLVLTFAYRSLRIGLISLVPNLFPLAFTGTVLYFSGQSLEIVSVCAFTICLGIAVDDSIHFLTRYQEERSRNVEQSVAIRRAFVGVGTALIMTTVILVAGFTTVMFSGLRDHRLFAKMGSLTLGSALFADMVFLPALLVRFAPKTPRGEQITPQEPSSSAGA